MFLLKKVNYYTKNLFFLSKTYFITLFLINRTMIYFKMGIFQNLFNKSFVHLNSLDLPAKNVFSFVFEKTNKNVCFSNCFYCY
jgi:hypothetical protein